jgi:UDP-N-acetylmuramate dehydrogenase
VLEVTFVLEPKDENEIQKQIEENLKWRQDKQPSLEKHPSCGSVFKKIDGVGAGRLIEQTGLKGYSIGDIQVSEKHANFLVNNGEGRAADVLLLVKLIQEKVKEKTGYQLETEISLIGEF